LYTFINSFAAERDFPLCLFIRPIAKHFTAGKAVGFIAGALGGYRTKRNHLSNICNTELQVFFDSLAGERDFPVCLFYKTHRETFLRWQAY
jgi:hypothetical protein